jgi:hypothetical protein
MLMDLDWRALTETEPLDGPGSSPARLRSLFRIEGFGLPIEGFPELGDLETFEVGLSRALSVLPPGARLGDWVGRGYSLADVTLLNPTRARRARAAHLELGTAFVYRSVSFGIDFSMRFPGSELDLEIVDPRIHEFLLGPQRLGDELCQAAYSLFGPQVGATAIRRECSENLTCLGIAEELIEPASALLVEDTLATLQQDQNLRSRVRQAYCQEEAQLERGRLRAAYRPDVLARKGW